MFVLDTNVIGELHKSPGRANSGVVRWVHGQRDALLAATAITRGMTVVTRNERDFDGAAVVNPWTGGSDRAY